MMQSEFSTGRTDPVPAAGAVHGPEALLSAVVTLLRAARRDVRLSAPQLDPAVFATAVVADALARFVAQHPRNRARLLVEDRTQLLRDHGRLLRLARRLADGIELREIADDDRGARDLYLTADGAVHLLQEDIGRSDGVIAAAVPHATRKLIERFDAAWERGTPIAARTLGL